MISDIHKSIFIQIPKNAGSSMVEYLGRSDFYKVDLSRDNSDWDNGGYKIGTARRLQELHNIWPNYFKFAFVRNPWDRMISSWSWLIKTKKIKKMGFKEFVMKYPFKSPGADWHTLPQYIHICDKKLHLMVDFIGRFENLNKDFEKICDKINIHKGNLPHKKKTNHKPYWEYYDSHTIKRCAEIFKRDIAMFGYKFRK